MRITHNLTFNKFARSLNKSSRNLNSITDKVSSGMNFSKASENTSDAIKAFKIRKALARSEQYESNIKDIAGLLDQTETTLMGIKDIMVQAKESLIQGSTGTMSAENKNTIASIIESLKEQLLKLCNSSFAGKYVFGGPNTTTAPFTVNAGKLFYNGEDLDNAVVSSESIFADLGLGISFDALGNLDTASAFSISTPGSIVTGNGIDADGLPNNIYNLLSSVVVSLQSNDIPTMQLQIKKLTESADKVMVSVAGIGERIKFVEFLNDRIQSDMLNLQTKQSDVEDVNRAEAIVNYNSAEMAYTASLQMGAKLIQKSLLDFLQ